MTVEHRFACVECGERVRGTGADSAVARQRARERGASHINEVHSGALADSTEWPDELAPDDLLTGAAAYGSLHGWLVPEDHLLVCADCGYHFGNSEDDAGRSPVGDAGLVCERCHERCATDREDRLAEAIEEFLR